MRNKLIFAVAAIMLAGCSQRSAEQAEAMLTNPDINFVGVYDGCEVKYVDRGYQVKSFYLAKCGGTTTTTRNYSEQVGKTTEFRRSTAITQEIEKLEAEKAVAVTKEKALEKLTHEEKSVLGIK